MKKMFLVALLMICFTSVMHGQGCSVCTKTTQGLSNKHANGINSGIIYLAFLPLALMGTLGYIWWKSNKVS